MIVLFKSSIGRNIRFENLAGSGVSILDNILPILENVVLLLSGHNFINIF